MTFNDTKTTGMVFGARNVNCKAIQVNGNNVECVTMQNTMVTVILLRVLTGLSGTSEAKCLLNVMFEYFSHIAAPIIAQF